MYEISIEGDSKHYNFDLKYDRYMILETMRCLAPGIVTDHDAVYTAKRYFAWPELAPLEVRLRWEQYWSYAREYVGRV